MADYQYEYKQTITYQGIIHGGEFGKAEVRRLVKAGIKSGVSSPKSYTESAVRVWEERDETD